MKPFQPHPNLSKEINDAIAESELLGGCDFAKFPDGKILFVRTWNTQYEVRKNGNRTFIRGSKIYCPDWTECCIHGSTWGGSMIKTNFVGRNMHLEFWTAADGIITTSLIADIEEGEFYVHG